MQRTMLASAVAVGALALPAAAEAHVTLQPNEAAAGAFTVENVRVPNERDDAATTKVDVALPPGFVSASYQAVPGWTTKVTKSKLDQPIKTDDGTVTEQVSRITWTARSRKDAIQPGQFRDFPLSVQIPGKAGDTLTFKALQTYSNGEIVRWIGAPDAAEPAPQVKVVAASDTGHGTAAKETAAAPATPVAATTSDSSGKASKGLAIAALIVGAVGLLAGGVALATGGRRP
jgi:periplasmic copper chaperone A